MTGTTIMERISAVVGEVLEIDDLVLEPGMTVADVEGWDSVATVEIMVALEGEFDIHFRTGEMASLENVAALANRIHEHMTTPG